MCFKVTSWTVFLVIIFSSFAPAVEASHNKNLVDDIQNLAREIDLAVRDSRSDPSELEQAKVLMLRALDLIEHGDRDQDLILECIERAFHEYRRLLPTDQAQTRATQGCRQIKDLEVLDFLITQHQRSISPIQATDLALLQASMEGIREKLAMIEFAFDKYRRQYSPTEAASMAVEIVLQVPLRGGLECFERVYPRFSRQNPPARSMELTGESCAAIHSDF